MLLNLNQIGQIAMPVSNADRSEAFYGEKLGFRKLFRFGNMVYFDCAGVRLWLDQVPPEQGLHASVLYFRCADIRLATKELETRGVVFTDKPHLVAELDDHDLWMTFFTDPDDHILALMQEAPKGYKP